MNQNINNEWEPLKYIYGFEINKKFPHFIRKVGSIKPIILERYKKYISIKFFNNKPVGLHQVIATQWIENPLNYKIVDHINGDIDDWHIENLRWTNNKENSNNIHTRNGKQLNLVEDIPDSCKPLDVFRNKRIDDLYIDVENKEVYKYNSVLFEHLVKLASKTKGEYINFKSKRFYINDIINAIDEQQSQIIYSLTEQGYTTEYLDSLPETVIPIKEFRNKKLKRIYWFDNSNNRIIKLNNKDDECKYRYIRSLNIFVQYQNGYAEEVKTEELIKFMNPTYDENFDSSINEAIEFITN